MAKKCNKLELPWLVSLFLILIIFIGFIVYKPYSTDDLQDNSVLSGLRGDVILIIQKYPSSTSNRRVWIGRDGLLTYGKADSNIRKDFQVSLLDTETINELQKDWCSNSPLYQQSKTNTIHYEIGLRCDYLFSSVPYKKIDIFSSNLPPILKMVLSQFPEMN